MNRRKFVAGGITGGLLALLGIKPAEAAPSDEFWLEIPMGLTAFNDGARKEIERIIDAAAYELGCDIQSCDRMVFRIEGKGRRL